MAKSVDNIFLLCIFSWLMEVYMVLSNMRSDDCYNCIALVTKIMTRYTPQSASGLQDT